MLSFMLCAFVGLLSQALLRALTHFALLLLDQVRQFLVVS